MNTQCRIVFINEGKRMAKNFKARTIHAFKSKVGNNYFTHIITDSDVSDIYPEKMLVSTYILPFNYNKLFTMTNGGMIIISLVYDDELFGSHIAKQLLFSMQNDNDNVKIYKEGFIPKELEEYLFNHKVKLNIN